jgi:putative transposase
MSNQLYPSDLTDSQWEIIQELIPPAKSGGRPRSLEMRMVINAVQYVVVGGIQWRMLPKEYPKWQSVYTYFRAWRTEGVWRRIHDTLRARVRQRAGRHTHPTAGALDSQSVKSTALAGIRGYDKGKQVKGRKRHLLVDTLGLLLAVVVTAASLQDRDGARRLLARMNGARKKLRKIWVDGGYRGQLLDWVAAHRRCHLQPVLRPDGHKGFTLLPHRWVVAPRGYPTFAWLNHHRRLSKDYERIMQTSETLIYIAMIRIMLRRLAPS